MNIITHVLDGCKTEPDDVKPLPKLDWYWEIECLPLGNVRWNAASNKKQCATCQKYFHLESFSVMRDRHGHPRYRASCNKCRTEINRQAREKKRLAIANGSA